MKQVIRHLQRGCRGTVLAGAVMAVPATEVTGLFHITAVIVAGCAVAAGVIAFLTLPA